MDMNRFLRVAVRTAGALAKLHQEGTVHQNIRPGNIVVPDDEGEVSLTGVTAEEPSSEQHESIPNSALPYISPEQTGRMNRPVDHRTDLYSLGIVFYEMLADAYPFQANDPIGWVHCHIARPPRPLNEAAPEVPDGLSNVIMKLLAKLADDRYQSARGLEVDLKRCLAEYEVTGTIEPFPLGLRDTSDKLQFPSKLYGRADECASLLDAFERSVGAGLPELFLVTGYSGIGKTSVVLEVQKPIVRERGFFVSGKFEQYKRDIPYLTITQAFRELVRQILTESDLDKWKLELEKALGANAQLVIDVVPQVELILGPQPPVAPLPPSEAQARFIKVFQKFIGVFARREHPLVLFLDDLQWADLASLKLIHQVLAQTATQYLFIIGAYRDNEVSPSHPLMTTLDEMRKDHVRTTTITLGPLSLDHLMEFVADTFRCHPERADPMARLLRIKTDGNPFFVIQFLSELHKEQMLRFDAADGAWRWSVADIQARNFTDNIVDFMVAKLKKLPDETQQTMRLAACIGNQCDVQILTAIHDKPVESIHQDLRSALREGLMLRRGSSYKFLHDRIQQAAYLLIPEEQRGQVHLEIGRLLLSRVPEAEREDRLFDIVNHLNSGLGLISDDQERYRLAALNLQAGRRAKSSSAYSSAVSYLSAAAQLLPSDCWEREYQLTYDIYSEYAECACVVAQFSAVEDLCAAILGHATTAIEKCAAHCTRIQMHIMKVEPHLSVQAGLECLKLFGVDMPANPEPAAVRDRIVSILNSLKGKQIADLIHLPAMNHPEKVAMMNMLTILYPALFYTDPNLTDLIVCLMVKTSIDFGNSAASAKGYAMFGKALVDRLKEYELAYDFGKLAFDLVEKEKLSAAKGDVANFFAVTISIWTRHVNTNIEYNRIGFNAAVESGDVNSAMYNSANLSLAMLFRGDPLEHVYRSNITTYDYANTTAKLPVMADIFLVVLRFIQNMRGLTDYFGTLNGDSFDQNQFEEKVKQGIPYPLVFLYLVQLQSQFMAGHYLEAVLASEDVGRHLVGNSALLMSVEYPFFTALSMAACYFDVPEARQAEFHRAIKSHSDQLKHWAEHCPDNFLGKHLLVSAEIARIEGRHKEAGQLYDSAVKAFRESLFVHNEGLANELAAHFYIREGYGPAIPRTYLNEAKTCYTRWGAFGKVNQLIRRFPEFFEAAPDPDQPPASRRTMASAEQLDTMTTIKASQALSSDLTPERLIATLTRIVIEHAGAQRCCLILPVGDDLVLAAEGSAEHHGIDVRIPDAGTPPNPALIPFSVLNYVRRTREKLILNDGAMNAMFSSDEYIGRIQPKSILCLPIVRNNAVVGILYLENQFAKGAFHPKRLPLVEFLAAISLQNTELFSELTQENAERRETEALLQKSAARAQRLLEMDGLIPWEFDSASGKFVYIGPQAAQALGYTAEQWQSEGFLSAHIHPSQRESALPQFKKALAANVSDRVDMDFTSAQGRTVRLRALIGAKPANEPSTITSGFFILAP